MSYFCRTRPFPTYTEIQRVVQKLLCIGAKVETDWESGGRFDSSTRNVQVSDDVDKSG